jgi:hypothetical protein
MSEQEPYGVCVHCRAWWTRVDEKTTTGHREECPLAPAQDEEQAA